MKTCIHSNRIFIDGDFRAGYLYFEGKKITGFSAEAELADRCIDWGDHYLVPGLIDLHCHGALGYDYAKASPTEMTEAIDYHLRHGATTQLPTVTSGTPEEMEAALERLSAVSHPSMAGVHLEGPYFSPEQCGAQDPTIITAPIAVDYERLLRRFGGLIRRWSYAPERDPDGSFLRAVSASKVISSAGHTNALFTEMKKAVEEGCSLVTHLYSCSSTVTREGGFRRGGVLEAALLIDDLDVELIADGCHLPEELVQLVYKIKGAEKIALVTDALPLTGTDAKESTVGGVACILEDGVCKLPDRSAFAGSIATADRLVQVVTGFGIPFADALVMGSETPARILGLPKGKLRPGYDADLLALDDDLKVCHVILGGQEIF